MIEEKGLEASVADKIGEYVKLKGTLTHGSNITHVNVNLGGPELLRTLEQDQPLQQNTRAKEGISEMTTLFELVAAYGIVGKVKYSSLFDRNQATKVS